MNMIRPSVVRGILFAILTLVNPPGSSGQYTKRHFERITTADGLSSSRLYDVARDTNGFLWIGGSSGLDRYDGYSIRTYRNDRSDSTSIPEGPVTALHVGPSGRFWLGTSKGRLSLFDDESNRFVRIRPTVPLNGKRISSILEDSDGTLWIGTRGSGLLSMDALGISASDSLRQRDLFEASANRAEEITGDMINDLISDPSGGIWVATELGLLKRDRSGSWRHYQNDPADSRTLSDNQVRALHIDAGGTLWVGTNNGGLNRFDTLTGEFTSYVNHWADPFSISNNTVWSIRESQEGNLWVGTSDGLNILDRSSGRFERIQHNPADPFSLSNDVVKSVRSFDQELVWVVTDRNLNKFRNRSQRLRHFVPDRSPDSPQGILAVCETSDGSLWLSTFSESANSRLKRIRGSVIHTFEHDPTDPLSISPGWVQSIREDTKGNLWIGTSDGYLNRFNPGTNSFAHYQWWNEEPDASDILLILEDSMGYLWLGTYNMGLYRFDPATGEFREFPSTLSKGLVVAALEGRDGTFWIGTDGGGLFEMNRSEGSLKRYSRNEESPNESVFSILEDEDGVLWLGTDDGLVRFRKESKSFEKLGPGEQSVHVYTVFPDRNGDLWLTTQQHGMYSYHRTTSTFRRYDRSDGLQGPSFFSGAAWRRSNGEFIFGGHDGYNIFHPDSLGAETTPPTIALTSFRVFDREIHIPTRIGGLRPIVLDYHQNYITLEFTSLDFTAPGRNRYVYFLEGFDKTWFQPVESPRAPYTAIPPGDYVFHVRGSNSDGIWTEKALSLPISILPPYWQTWWFRTILVILLVAALTGLYRYRVAQLLRIERMRVQIASDLHDDIGSNLSSIALISDLVRNQLANDQEQLARHLADSGRAARQTADSLKDIVWLIKSGNETVNDLVLRLKDSASKILVAHKHSFEVNGGSETQQLGMELRRHLILIYKEALNNIVKHAQADRVEISFAASEKEIRMRITDNGIGFDEASIKRGNGLNNLRDRAESINGTINIDSVEGEGTTVTLEIPC